MNVIGKKVLMDFAAGHAEARQSIASWVKEVEAATWNGPHELRLRYPRASILGDGKVVFDLKGNSFRLYVQISYLAQTVLVLRIATHAEYSKWKL